ncbi:MAG: hypothetical protein NTW28_33575, partial [Candidatus Solibacter sp.]|nr:hypothetical protein [Candidatus Solibacter sp.]
NSLYVRPWLPAELPPARPGSSSARQPRLSDYLGKKVELVATLEREALKGVGEVDLLVVQSAKLVR